MSLESIADISISSASRGVSRRSFGVAMVIGRHDAFADLAREYNLATAAADCVTDGIVADSPIHRAVSALARNTPKIKKVIVGRLITPFDHEMLLTVRNGVVEEGKVFSFDLIAPNGGATTEISYTALSGDTESDVATAIAGLITAVSGITATPSGDEIDIDADNSDEMWYIDGLNISDFEFEDQTADSSLVTEYGNIVSANSKAYGVILADPNSKARVSALAAQVETEERIFGYTTHDTGCGDPLQTGDVAYTLNAAQYFRTYGIYSGNQGKHAAAVWMGNRFPSDPGSSTWDYKPLSGVVVDDLSDAFVTALADKKCNCYIEPDNATPCTQDGWMASGEWIDVIRGRDWLVVRLRERVFSLLVNAPKVPFTNPGAQQVKAQFDAQMEEGIANNYLAAEPVPIVTVPDVLDADEVSAADKIARTLPGVYFEATLAGAIHKIRATGVLNV